MRTTVLLIATIAAVSCSSARSPGHDEAADARFESLAAKYVEEMLPMRPEQATRLGDHRFADRLDDYSAVGVMPEYRRGVAVAYCDPAGALEKNGETFFAISPTPADWPAKRVESFFREYNDYMVQNLTVHEAMPGHYLQLAHSNRFKAPTMIRSIFHSGVFAEGWAVYAEQVMAEAGYGGPEVRLQQLKMRMRVIINAILDSQVHTAGMTEQQAMALMMNEGLQEEGEAAGKWRRVALTSAQLSNYYVGAVQMDDIRRAYEAKNGGAVNYKQLHDRMLSFGTPAPKYVREMMGL